MSLNVNLQIERLPIMSNEQNVYFILKEEKQA